MGGWAETASWSFDINFMLPVSAVNGLIVLPLGHRVRLTGALTPTNPSSIPATGLSSASPSFSSIAIVIQYQGA